MSQNKTQKVFIQYRYCPLCRSNHKRGKKHILTERHQKIVKNIVNKFSKRIAGMKNAVNKPVVKDVKSSDAARQCWCYFCQHDVYCHKVNITAMGDCVVEYCSMLEHIVREDHVKNTTDFLKENRVDMNRTSEFVLTSQNYITFLENVEKEMSLYFKDKAQVLQEVSSHIRAQSAYRQQVVSTALLEQSTLQQEMERRKSFDDVQLTSGKFSSSEDGQRIKTAQAFGDGLTAVDRSKEDDTVGNIYTNAIPPWMLPDSHDIAGPAEIGPTISDLEKHRKMEKKAKLPSCRVGFKFDRKTDQPDTWMPSFGGVWHHTRRSDSVKQFNRRRLEKQKLSSANLIHGPSRQLVAAVSETTVSPDIPLAPGLANSEQSSLRTAARTTATAPAPWNSYITSNASGDATTSPHQTPLRTASGTTATAPAPWNRYITSNGSGGDTTGRQQTPLPPALQETGRDLLEPGCYQSVPPKMGFNDNALHGNIRSTFKAPIKPYISKRKRQVTASDTDTVNHLGKSESPSMPLSCDTCQIHQPCHDIGNPYGISMNIPEHPNSGRYLPLANGHIAHGYPVHDQHTSSFNHYVKPAAGYQREWPGNPHSFSNKQTPRQEKALSCQPRLISTPLLQKAEKKKS